VGAAWSSGGAKDEKGAEVKGERGAKISQHPFLDPSNFLEGLGPL